jgi:Protein of unknown function (DUF664)
MTESGRQADLHRYLQDARDALLWKLDGLSGYDVRRPLVPTGTHLVGLVKHQAGVEMGYFGETFCRPALIGWPGTSPTRHHPPAHPPLALSPATAPFWRKFGASRKFRRQIRRPNFHEAQK